MSTAAMDARRTRALSDAWQRPLRQVSGVTAVGLGLGFLVGGVGSRLAMRALFLTSQPSVRGVISDDGFAIGRFSAAATLNLLIAGTVIGVIGAFVYAAVRPFLLGSRWLRYTGCALGGGAVVGSMLVHVDGVDFTLLGPTWFAIALFVALPALFAALAAPAIDRVLGDESWFMQAPPRLALLPLLVFLFPPLLVLVGLPAMVVLAVRERMQRAPALRRVITAPAAMWSVRALWFLVAVAGVVMLARDTAALL